VVAARYAKAMPPLASFVEDAARSGNIEIEESGAKPDVPHGKKYVEHVLLMKLRNVGLLGIVKTFEKIERSGYPVAITRLNLKPRAGEPDSYDVEAHVSAYESKDAPKKEPVKDDADDADEEETP
jgi:general secretion pathway protein M